MYLRERLGLQKMKLKQMQTKVEHAKALGTKHYAANETLRKRVSSRKKKQSFGALFFALPVGTAFNSVFWSDIMLCLLQGTGIRFS